MTDIRLLTTLDPTDLLRLMTGYIADATYRIRKTESEELFALTLELVPLPQPYRKRYDHLDQETLDNYRQLPALGFSFGAYDGEQCVGIALAEPQQWNRSLWVRELHVDTSRRRRGIGRLLVEALAAKGHSAGLRTLVCETQNRNVPAIRFYRSVGFHIDGVDLSYYSNDDFPDGEIAVFMKKSTAL